MQPTPDNPYAIIVCPRCFGTGYILTRYRETCPDCGGSGRITEVKARELNQRETEVVENALTQRINELEAERDAQDAALARLRDALRDVCAAAEERHSDGWRSCSICEGWRPVPEAFHAPDCPIAAARALLDGGA